MKKRITAALLIFSLAFLIAGTLSGCEESTEMKTAKADFVTQSDRVMAQQAELTAAINDGKTIAATDEKLLEPEKMNSLNSAISEGESAVIEEPVMPSKQEDIVAKTEELKSADCSAQIEAISSAEKDVKESIARYKLVDQPTTEYVTTCIQRIGYIDNCVTLTEDTDGTNHLGKPGWYTGKVVFHSTNIEHMGYDKGYSTLEEIGNPAGGCVEIFANEEDANRRNDDLAGMEGTEKNPGAHEVVGTCVIRASEEQTTTAMNQEIIDLRVELTKLNG